MTKKDRNRIYLEALKELRLDFLNNDFYSGICGTIYHACREYSICEENFPELYLFAPDSGPFLMNRYWWARNTEGFESRETALLFMIEMTK